VCTGISIHPEFGRRGNRKKKTRHHIRGQPRDNLLSQEPTSENRKEHMDIRHQYMRDLHDSKALDVRFKGSENNSVDIMTKNTTRKISDKHTQQIRNGTLPFWKEDVKQDSSVTEFTKSQSLAASTITTSPGDSSVSTSSIKSRTSRQPLEEMAGGQTACILL
jgi:hypothetical protein